MYMEFLLSMPLEIWHRSMHLKWVMNLPWEIIWKTKYCRMMFSTSIPICSLFLSVSHCSSLYRLMLQMKVQIHWGLVYRVTNMFCGKCAFCHVPTCRSSRCLLSPLSPVPQYRNWQRPMCKGRPNVEACNCTEKIVLLPLCRVEICKQPPPYLVYCRLELCS